MAGKSIPTSFMVPATTVRHSLDGAWSQADLGREFDATSLSVIADLDPTGAKGVVREVLELFRDSLEPELSSIEAALGQQDGAPRILSVSHKMKSAAAQMGALRLAKACEATEKHIACGPARAPDSDATLGHLVEMQMAEIIRVQRKLRALLD